MPETLPERHPFKELNDDTRLKWMQRGGLALLDWEEKCRALRANPGIPVFLRHQGTPHVCGDERSLKGLGCTCGECDATAVSMCEECGRVGVVWDRDWVVPCDLQARVLEAEALLATVTDDA